MFLLFLAGILSILWLYSNSWRLNSKLRKRLPPGNLGWPIIGELIPYITIARSTTPFRFTQEREAKYGPIYKTRLLTGNTIMLTDAEGVKFVLQNEGSLFASGYPQSVKNVIGKYAMLFNDGYAHKRFHTMERRFISSTPLKKHLTKEMEILMKQKLESLPREKRILLHKEVQGITHDFIMKQVFGIGPGKISSIILEEFDTIMKGIIFVPIMIPGTPYYKAMKARERLRGIIMPMVEERRAHPEVEHHDILQALINEKKEGESDDLIFDNVLVNIANAEGVPAIVLTLCILNLSQCPEALAKLREENFAIKKGKDPNEGLTWSEYMSLEFTHCVLNETLRLANGAQGLMRRAVQDVEYRGYLIPKGWTVLPYFLNLHFDEKVYPNPTKFHPWRWLEKSIPSTFFVPFGSGAKICPGQELAKVQTAIFLHHFVTQFSWEAEPDTVINFPVVRTQKNLPVVLHDL